ncbi:drug resistance transporter, EmrB/QacA subfamily [Actinacidiphila alni]|uniref:Drug resistance transporter, EmrB/QacA subfamily n=1 Tax=Actinacidiphila alni TaxID=380248 RepID=A0A1I2J4J4_9ACTN|nr:MFS transporter [Actinacidiphila alni]SFF48948.1 drug resistance transporter, EmrB/QacA subfamily [Actinacidiphila alni]
MNKWRGNPWVILTILSFGFFMTLLDLTIVNIAIPDMVDSIDASLDQILWVVNAYTLALAVLMITAGRLGDLMGKKNLFIGGVTLFTAASLACGLAQDPWQLIAFRAVQGFGAALLLPQTLSMIADVFPDEKRGVALGIWGTVAGLASVAGPSLGGLLVTKLSWRWIFFVNVPIGVLALIASFMFMPSAARTVKHRFDIPGVVLTTIALFLLAFGLIEGQKYSWNGAIWGTIAAGVVVLAIFLVYQRGQQENEPLVPFVLFKDRNFSVVNFVGIAVSFGVVGLLLPLTIYLQSVLGFSALKAGGVLVPMAIGSMLTAGPSGVIAEKFGGKYILMGGLIAYIGGVFWIIETVKVGQSWTGLIAPVVIIGAGMGCTFTPMATEVMRNVPPRLTGAASGVNNALRQVGSVMAGAVIGAVLQNQLASSLKDQAAQRAGAVPADFRGQFLRNFDDAGKHLEVGGQSSSAMKFPTSVPADVAHRIQDAAAAVFGHGFIDAMKPTMVVPMAVLAVGAIACLIIVGPNKEEAAAKAAAKEGAPAPDATAGAVDSAAVDSAADSGAASR